MGEPVVRVRPRGSLLRTAVVSLLVGMVPASIALYSVAIPAGRWLWVLLVQLWVLAACALLAARQLRLVTEVDERELRGNGIATPMVRVPLDEIAHVFLVRTTIHGGIDETTQLLVTGSRGERLFRLRGTYWPPGALERVAEALPAPVSDERDPIPIREFWRRHPGSAYWFENRRIFSVLVPLCVIVISSGVAAGVMFGLGA